LIPISRDIDALRRSMNKGGDIQLRLVMHARQSGGVRAARVGYDISSQPWRIRELPEPLSSLISRKYILDESSLHPSLGGRIIGDQAYLP